MSSISTNFVAAISYAEVKYDILHATKENVTLDLRVFAY